EPSPSQALSVNGSARLTQYLFLEDYAGGDSKTAGIFSYNDLLYFRRHTAVTDVYEQNMMNLNLTSGDLTMVGNVRADGGRVYLSGATNYLSSPVTGQYGSVQINGAGLNNYEGYSIDGRVVFMHDGGTTSGIYNDVNNQWMLLAYLNGEIQLTYAGTWRLRTTTSGVEVNNTLAFASDRKYKENIMPVDNALDKLSQINGVSFNWKDTEARGANKQLGVIAQDVQAVFPELVLHSEDEDGNDYLTVNYNGLVAPMIEAIKELKAENESLKKSQAENADLKLRIEALEQAVNALAADKK
ncbi:MAG: hypothetical protein CMH30_00415, partial [Micavibrio sp.]|nr:hypothetical protein [Micavibrio sp.]